MGSSGFKVLFAFQCGVIAFLPGAFADDVPVAPPKYYLYQDVPHSSTGGCALVNAKWWVNESGEKGTDGNLPDPTGDYYTKTYRLDTRNENSGASLPFECNSLHIGELSTQWSRMNVYTANHSTFKILGQGLFLHRGLMQLNWKPVTIDGNITVDSPESDAFTVYDRYCDTVLNIPAAMHSPKNACLKFYANSEESAAGSRTFVVKVTGDCSDWYGNFSIGKDSNTLGRNTRFHPPVGGMPGSMTVKPTGGVVLDSGDATVGGVSFKDGSALVCAKGQLVVTNAFSVSGIVNVSFEGIAIPNIEHHRVAIMSVPARSAISMDNFRVADFDSANLKEIVLSIEENADGSKTLYGSFVRKSVYVSPFGDDGNTGADGDNPFKTLAHVVSVFTNGVVYALPGTYSEGVCEEGDTNTQSRVRVPSMVYLKAIGGSGVTAIKGAAPSGDGKTGPGATRCVKLDDGAVLHGFTLTGGHVYSSNASAPYDECSGGAVHAKTGSVIVECTLDGNVAMRAGAGYGGNYIRCVFGTNTALHGTWAGTDIFGQRNRIKCFDCAFVSGGSGVTQAYQFFDLYNCTFSAERGNGPNYECTANNCLIRSKDNLSCANNSHFNNCVIAREPGGDASLAVGCVITNLSETIDSGCNPAPGSAAVDFGDRELYLAGWKAAGINSAFMGGDLNGGQRIYNGKIDAGCAEYDWRGDYTGIVGKRRMEVVEASEDVEAEEPDAIRLTDGAKFAVDWDSANGGEALRMACEATVAGSGVLTVSMDGETIATVASGTSSVQWKSTAENHKLVFSYSGEGEASIGRFENKNGFRVRIR